MFDIETTPLPATAPATVPAPAPAPSQAPASGVWVIPKPTPAQATAAAVRLSLLALAVFALARGDLPALAIWHRPVTAPLHATLVYDSDGTTPHATGADVTAGDGPEAGLKALNCAWREYDKDAPTLKSKGLDKYVAKAGGPPALIVQAEGSAEPLFAGPSPGDAAGVVERVRKIRGK